LVRVPPGTARSDQHKGCCSDRLAKIPCVTRHLRKIRAALEIPPYQRFYDGEAKPKKIKALDVGREGMSLSRRREIEGSGRKFAKLKERDKGIVRLPVAKLAQATK
jgi:hypothetical protein